MGLRNHSPFRSVRDEQFDFTFKFTTDTTTDPSTYEPDYGSDLVVAHAGTNGDFSITFSGSKKPLALSYGDACILGDEPTLDAKVVSYTPSTGVLLVTVYEEDGTSGISAAADTSGKVVQVRCVFTNSSYAK